MKSLSTDCPRHRSADLLEVMQRKLQIDFILSEGKDTIPQFASIIEVSVERTLQVIRNAVHNRGQRLFGHNTTSGRVDKVWRPGFLFDAWLSRRMIKSAVV